MSEYITALKNSDRFGPQVVEHRIFPEVRPTFAPPCGLLPPEIEHLPGKSGISDLYSHQEKAIAHVLAKRNVLVATPTASGKSLIYNLPVFAELIQNPRARALYLFPLKALAQDQIKTINKLGQLLPAHFAMQARIPAAIYDGDTSGYQRKKIRDHLPGILVTNPDMLHLSMLPYHDKWANLFANLTHIIIDEVHTYRGVFGSHMAWVIKRLKRICSLYGSKPVFILSSATIGNPEELAGQLIAAPIEIITRSGAPRAPRNILLLNPLDSAAAAATMLLKAAVYRGLRTIVYTQSRKMTELIAMWAEGRLGELKGKVASYRAGFLPEDRREIEQQLVSGSLLGVISTSALELGIDIGNLDICILVGYPGSMMATWQRAGRVGRGRQESLTVLVGHEDALDQHFMRNPDDFFSRDVEPVVLNPGNEMIGDRHLICAAAEVPLTREELLVAQNNVIDLLARLTLHGKLLQSADGNTWFSARKYPHRDVELRGSGTRYRIVKKSGRELLGEIDGFRAFKECHPGAIYLHRAQTRHVDSLDLEAHEIVVSPFKGSYYTRAMTDKTTDILEVNKTVLCGSTRVHFGSLRVTENITGYQKILIGRQKIITCISLDLPPNIFETQGFWIEIPDRLRQQNEKQNFHFMGGIHAMEHAIIGMMPLMVLCDRNDIGGISHPRHEQTEGAAVFIYDGYAGGIGLTKKGFSVIHALMKQTRDTVKACPCDIGCPSCVHSPKCGSGNRPIDKQACLSILEGLLAKGRNHMTEAAKTSQQRTLFTQSHFSAPQKPAEFRLPGRYGVFDVETQKSAKEVGGWHRADLMRISVAVLYDSELDEYKSYLEDEMDRLIERLFELELVIGFNNKRFDNKVLSAYTNKKLGRLPSLDILEEIFTRLGYRLSLDRLAEKTLGVQKSGDGLLALKWFKQGRMEKLTRYCLKDVKITRDLFLFGLRQQHLLFQNKAGKTVRLPVDFQNAVERIIEKKPLPAHGQTSFP